MDAVRRLCELRANKAALETALRECKADIKLVEAELLPQFVKDGLQSVKTSNGATAYLHPTMWAKRKDETVTNAMIVAAMEAAGLHDMTTANWMSLSAYLREMDGVPPPLAAVLDLDERYEVRTLNPGAEAALPPTSPEEEQAHVING